jgi:hypothetical protein
VQHQDLPSINDVAVITGGNVAIANDISIDTIKLQGGNIDVSDVYCNNNSFHLSTSVKWII